VTGNFLKTNYVRLQRRACLVLPDMELLILKACHPRTFKLIPIGHEDLSLLLSSSIYALYDYGNYILIK